MPEEPAEEPFDEWMEAEIRRQEEDPNYWGDQEDHWVQYYPKFDLDALRENLKLTPSERFTKMGRRVCAILEAEAIFAQGSPADAVPPDTETVLRQKIDSPIAPDARARRDELMDQRQQHPCHSTNRRGFPI